MKKLLILLFVVCTSIPAAYAHPVIIDSNPQSSSTAPAGTTQVVIRYSEAIEIEFSAIKVFDNNGNQIDNKDTKYFEGESSLVVTTPPLSDGVYTVTSKVLSRVDGHLVDETLVFGVGNVSVPPPKQKDITESIYFPEAASRFPGIVGQVIVLGAAISSLAMWKTVEKKNSIKQNISELQKFYHTKFSSITGVGLFLVFASNILMLVVQTIRLQTSASDVLETSFGSVWILRMSVTVILLAIWFLMENKASVSHKKQGIVLGLSLILIGTTTLIGHGTASEQLSALVIDYAHNLIASVWIGGVIFFAFILLPTFARLDEVKKEQLSLLMIPRFSSMITISLGIIIITGPTLLWLLEDDLGALSQSYYGLLIIAKIIIASVMVALGGYNQVKIQRTAEKKLASNEIVVHKKLKKSLKTEAVLGIVLLGVVALLTNASLPTSQAQEETQQVRYGFDTTAFSENVRFDVRIVPFSSGANSIVVSASDLQGNPLDDLSAVKVKISNPQRNIAPLEVPLTKVESQDAYEGSLTFGFSGKWNVELEAQRTKHANEATSFVAIVKPHVSELKTEIVEYSLPDNAAPLYPAYDGDDTIWISDTSKPRLWKFSISQKQFTSYEFEGQTTVFLKIVDGRIWFTDTPNSTIGYFDPDTEEFHLIPLPTKSIPISLESDLDGNIWIALVDRHMLLKYNSQTNEFEEHATITGQSGPVALTRDTDGNIWFAESQAGKIGVISPQTGDMQEFAPDSQLKEPFALLIDQDGNLWISEHVGLSIVKFNPILQTFERVPIKDPNSLPFGLVQDRYENIWIAQHTSDKLGVYDPHKGEFVEVDIPTKSTFTQFVTADKNGNIWFVEQRGNKIGSVTITEGPSVGVAQAQTGFEIRYSELVSPLVSAGIIASSLFFVKSIHDKRRLDSLVE
ncbi:MAG TPA: CopD family protein [Candidatus Nitrosotenuis sp.]|nr:CopD family protein [Candidatus Nitrosotenuis sp.]